jgi:hypothetical protein
MAQATTVDTLTVYMEILEGKRNRFPHGTWDPCLFDGMQNFMKCFRYLVIDVLKLTRKEILRDIDSKKFFSKYKLTSGLCMLFDGSPFAAIEYSFPELKINFWEMKRCPSNKWDFATVRQAVRWLFIDELKMDKQSILQISDYNKFLEAYGMKYMLRRAFNILTIKHKRDVNFVDLFNYTFPEFQFTKEDLTRDIKRGRKLKQQKAS